MDYKRIALLLEDQLKLAAQREEELLKVIADQNEQLNILTAEVKSLNSSILSLEKALLERMHPLKASKVKSAYWERWYRARNPNRSLSPIKERQS